MEQKHTWNLGYWLLALLLLFMLQDIWQNTTQVQTVPYSEFEKALSEGRIAEVTVSERSVIGRLKAPEGNKVSLVAVRVEPDLAARLEKFDVPYTRVVESTLLRDLMSWVVPALIFFGVWFFLFRGFADKQGLGGMLSIGKSRAKIYVQANTGVTFADVAGVDEARHELEEVVDFLKHPQEYGRLGAHIPKGVLLVGPP
ncbi:MAG: ATP-dependent metallopeptidase FtsH/Yme1/Tma family protein, partial [Rhodoferax sp.]|nr:ATP-dependent metallopeptidase FtsH/Yme1/Tma family protein [Rhodoferax sp.]